MLTEFPLVWDVAKKIAEKYLKMGKGSKFFSYSDGSPLTRNRLIYAVKRAKKMAGMENFCCNDLRRTFCTRMRQAGCDYEVREYLMGHRIPGVSSRYSIFTVQYLVDYLKNIEEKVAQIWHTEDFKNEESVVPEIAKTVDRQVPGEGFEPSRKLLSNGF